MVLVVLVSAPILLFMCAALPSSNNVDITSLNEQVKKMDEVLQEMKSHSQAQEQKYSAVLSSVLSQLTQTTEELRASKNITEELQQEVSKVTEINNKTLVDFATATDELAELKQAHNDTLLNFRTTMSELAELKQAHNDTLLNYRTTMSELAELKQAHNDTLLNYRTTIRELAALKQSQNQSLIELNMVKSEVKSLRQNFSNSDSTKYVLIQLNSTQLIDEMNAMGYTQLTSSNMSWFSKEIGFAAELSRATTVVGPHVIFFDDVTVNEGDGYKKATGYFTAPVSGMYHLWTNVVYKTNSSAVYFHIQTYNRTFSSAFGKPDELYGTASTATLFYLKRGDRTWVRASGDVELHSSSSAGAMLIK